MNRAYARGMSAEKVVFSCIGPGSQEKVNERVMF
jgi:hypothetical protein